jgi:membrane-associated phospholipid phosphatase
VAPDPQETVADALARRVPAGQAPSARLAAAVAYSRVHTGVHYPGDVVIGSVTGAGTAAMVAAPWPTGPPAPGAPSGRARSGGRCRR